MTSDVLTLVLNELAIFSRTHKENGAHALIFIQLQLHNFISHVILHLKLSGPINLKSMKKERKKMVQLSEPNFPEQKTRLIGPINIT